MDLRKVFMQNMRKYRKGKKLSQMKLAELCETSTSYIGELEIGKKFPSVEMMQRIALALEVEPYRFLMDENDCNRQVLSAEMKDELINELCESVKSIVGKK